LKKKYELDDLALQFGHQVVRLPPYHCQYNPIELIWAQVKREVAERNKTFKLSDVEHLTSQAIDNVTKTDWEKCVHHAESLQEEDWGKEIVRDDAFEKFVIEVNDSDSESESDSDSDESENEPE
jgi:hypothetical protein